MARGISISEMGRRVGVSEGAIRYQIRQGHVRPLPNGKLDPDDADTLIRMQRVETGPDQRTARLLRVRVLGGQVKVQRIRLQIEQLKTNTIERAPLDATLAERSRGLIDRLTDWPRRLGPGLAEALQTDLDTAKDILRRFSALALAELGDVEADAGGALRRL